METHENDDGLKFVAQVNAAQQGLYALILSLVPNAHDARDVLAETNMALWKKRSDYDVEQEFWPWACRFARFQVLAFRKRQQRDRVVFSEDVINLLADDAQQLAAASDDMLGALDHCLDEVKDNRRDLLRLRYTEEHSVRRISAMVGRTPGATADLLYRIRVQLADCIRQRLAAE